MFPGASHNAETYGGTSTHDATMRVTLNTVGLFAGIGGIELGLTRAGHRCIALVEKDERARSILSAHFGIDPIEDIRAVEALPDADLVAAGFPCTDLSQAGRMEGIDGEQSGLVKHLFRLVSKTATKPEWLLLENVPFMLRLHKGRAMRYLVQSLEEAGYRWAYRVVNTQAFGLPQRRRRVFLVAARDSDPRHVLLADDAGPPSLPPQPAAYGFYWTEGNRGVGWAVDAIPPLKGGSGLSIPSAPAVWIPETGEFGCPDIRDAERLQGFEEGWTGSTDSKVRPGRRWLLVGNAVSVPLAAWIGDRLTEPGEYDPSQDEEIAAGVPLPEAAWGERGRFYRATVSEWPIRKEYRPLRPFLRYELTPLSERAAAGFHRRARASRLRFQEGFLEALDAYLERKRKWSAEQ